MLAGALLPPVSFHKAGVASFMKLGDIEPDFADANKTWWPLDKKFKGVAFIRQPNEVCRVTLNPDHDPLDLGKIMECFEVFCYSPAAAASNPSALWLYTNHKELQLSDSSCRGGNLQALLSMIILFCLRLFAVTC